jgi:hypothetical protein
MLVGKAKKLSVDADEIRNELKFLMDSAALSEPICNPDCTIYNDTGCQKNCLSAPKYLSSDVEYPLEKKVAPLAFELKRMGVFEPCWSCEGHLSADGKLWKLPRVWLYVHSIVHVRVLSLALKEMFINGILENEWGVVVTYSNVDNPSTCFSLQPEGAMELKDLNSLHKDLENMATKLVGMVRYEAQILINKVN